MTWKCTGIYPNTPPCGESGQNDRDAEKHTRATQHSTSSGLTTRGVEAVVEACGGAR